MSKLFETLSFTHGPNMKNRFMLAPMTNCQSHGDGILSDEELRWLSMRAEGGFGVTMTCAAHVQSVGQGFPGQLGVFSDKHIDGLSRLAKAIKNKDSISICQLHHAGMRSPRELIDTVPVCPSEDKKTEARALSTEEVEQLVSDFISAAVRVETAGFDGVEIHGAHGYILGQFLSPEINLREDKYGGSLENRCRILDEIIDGIRTQCRPDFMLGVRLSPERFGMHLPEILNFSQRLMDEDKIDFLDVSLWDVFKNPVEEGMQGKSLLGHFTELNRGNVRLGVAGKICTPAEAESVLAAGVDWVMLGRAAIIDHDFPWQMKNNPDFSPAELPISREHLTGEGLSKKFIDYMATWDGFVAD